MIVARQFRNYCKTRDFIAAPVGAVREPPEIRALPEAPLQKMSRMA
jgi:hypothetical protein